MATARGGRHEFEMAREVPALRWAYVGMSTNQPLTITIEQAAEILGVGRSTAYELVRSGDLKCIHLRRRIVVPVAHLAESLGVDRDAVWGAVSAGAAPPASPRRDALSQVAVRQATDNEADRAPDVAVTDAIEQAFINP